MMVWIGSPKGSGNVPYEGETIRNVLGVLEMRVLSREKSRN